MFPSTLLYLDRAGNRGGYVGEDISLPLTCLNYEAPLPPVD